jgi:hypothetical protein
MSILTKPKYFQLKLLITMCSCQVRGTQKTQNVGRLIPPYDQSTVQLWHVKTKSFASQLKYCVVTKLKNYIYPVLAKVLHV